MDKYTAETPVGLTDAEIDTVSGGEGYEANGAIRAVTQWFQDNTFRPGFSFGLYRDLYCK
jgi:hypothetical protein